MEQETPGQDGEITPSAIQVVFKGAKPKKEKKEKKQYDGPRNTEKRAHYRKVSVEKETKA